MNTEIEVPETWLKSDRIMGAINMVSNTIKRHQLIDRIAEARRVDAGSGGWVSDVVRENYLALIIEGKILIGS